MVGLYYWTGLPNFGDALSRLIVEWLGGRRTRFVTADENDKLVAIGSILDIVSGRTVVWGTGVRSPDTIRQRPLDIRAVRGPLTRSVLLACGMTCPPVYGDPAILLPLLYTPPKRGGGGIGILPHYSDRWLKGEGRMICPTWEPLRVVNAVCECDVLVTSSLHGLIVAETYGVPAMLWRAPQHMEYEPPFKFADYFASTERDVYLLTGGTVEQAAAAALKAPKPTFNRTDLLDAFPYEMFV